MLWFFILASSFIRRVTLVDRMMLKPKTIGAGLCMASMAEHRGPGPAFGATLGVSPAHPRDVQQNARLQLFFVQADMHQVADTDDTGQLAIL